METLVPDFYVLVEGDDSGDPDSPIGFFRTEEEALAAEQFMIESGLLTEGGYVYVVGEKFLTTPDFKEIMGGD